MPSVTPVLVEVCAEGLASALAAGAGGADRVELCENLAVGGVTPSAGAIAVACRRLAIPVHVLIRARGGPFTASPDEFAAMRHDIQVARDLGASGVVLGLLDSSGRVDAARVADLVALARPLSVTFHKAFDALPDLADGLETLVGLGVDRILTSGGATSARLGLSTLTALGRQAAGRIVILPGGGITRADLVPLAAAGLREVHSGSAVAGPGGVTDADRVRQFVAEARAAFAAPTRGSASSIWHLVPRDVWEAAVASGPFFRPESLQSEGFIHLSDHAEVAGSADRYFAACADLLALEVDPNSLRDPLPWVFVAERKASFPHLHGPLPVGSVRRVVAMQRGADGRFLAPPEPNGA